MTPTEAVLLTEFVKQCFPQQAKNFGEYTADAWSEILGDLRIGDCRTAVIEIAKRQPFVAPAEIIAEVRKIRADRIARSQIPAPPAALADHPRDYQRALKAAVKIAADGHALPAPQVQAITSGASSGSRNPARLGQAIGDLRRQLGPGRAPRRTLGDERQVARDQVAEMRAQREKAAEGGESA
jgi:hypothetical protein